MTSTTRAPSVAFLHTSPVHVETFDAIMAELAPDASAHHVVDEALLADAIADGLSREVIERVRSQLITAGETGAPVVVCTCSTIGSVAEDHADSFAFQAQRIDRAMADAAVRSGPNVLVVAALESTLQPTRELLEVSAVELGHPVPLTMHHIADAWQHFEAGDDESYWQAVAAGIREQASGHDVVVIAQASMAGATTFCNDLDIPILSSPRLGVERALAGQDRK